MAAINPQLPSSTYYSSKSSNDRIRASYLEKLGFVRDRLAATTVPRTSSRDLPVERRRRAASNTDELLLPTLPTPAVVTTDQSQAAIIISSDCALGKREDKHVRHDSTTTASTACSTVLCDYEEALFYYYDDVDDECASQQQKKQGVHFYHSVSVVEIPSHRDYDKECRRSMWNSFRAIEQNSERNIYEYWADGNDWRNATEEEGMIRTKKGRLVHPATWKLVYADLKKQHKRRHYRQPQHQHNQRHADYELQRRQQACVPSLTRFADT